MFKFLKDIKDKIIETILVFYYGHWLKQVFLKENEISYDGKIDVVGDYLVT